MKTLPIQHHIEFCEHGTKCEACCWNWTANSYQHGYGRAKANCYGKVETYAHRIMWAYYHKRQIPANKVICHSCHNKSCCNPTHLELLSTKQFADRRTHSKRLERINGKKTGNEKLTANQVMEIRSMAEEGFCQLAIATKFSVSQACISSILSGRTWGYLRKTG